MEEEREGEEGEGGRRRRGKREREGEGGEGRGRGDRVREVGWRVSKTTSRKGIGKGKKGSNSFNER
jgi:hypothetical protein